VATYLTTGGDKRFLGEVEGGPRNKLLDALGQYRVDEVTDAVMAATAQKLYPKATAATLNRQLYTPVISVLRLAAKGKGWKPSLTRPKGHSKLKPAAAPPETWWDAVLPECRPQLGALLIFCTTSSRRAGEAIRCLPEHFDPEAGTVFVGRDKNGNAILVKVPEGVVDAIKRYNWEAGPGLFGHYITKNRRNLFRDLKLACKRAGVCYFPPHKAGRHAFAKRFLDEGHSIAHLMGAGGWKSSRVPAELYGHYTYSEVAEDAKRIGDAFIKRIGTRKSNVVEFGRQQKRAMATKRLPK
jgi:integrase